MKAPGILLPPASIMGPMRKTTIRGLARLSTSLPGLPLVVLAAILVPSIASAQEWTRFRGPNGSGQGNAPGLPPSWQEGEWAWRVELPGPGHSQPVLWGDTVHVLSATADGSERTLSALATRDGATLWSRKLPSKGHPKHERNSFATTTPAVDAERIYLALSTSEASRLLALDHNGQDVWSFDLGPHASRHAGGASPILHDDLVILPNELDQNSSVLAVERATGKQRWRVERKNVMSSYATPCVIEVSPGKVELVLSSNAHGMYALDPRTGEQLWEAVVFGDKRTVSSPVTAGGLVWATCGSGGGGNVAVGIRPGGRGDVAKTHVSHRLTRSMPYVPTPVAHDDLLFFWGDAGVVTCVDARTGSQLWQERVRGSYMGSPVCVGGTLYCASEDGELVALAASREHRPLGRTPLGEGSRSTPAVAGGRLYVRTFTHLLCLGAKVPHPSSGAK